MSKEKNLSTFCMLSIIPIIISSLSCWYTYINTQYAESAAAAAKSSALSAAATNRPFLYLEPYTRTHITSDGKLIYKELVFRLKNYGHRPAKNIEGDLVFLSNDRKEVLYRTPFAHTDSVYPGLIPEFSQNLPKGILTESPFYIVVIFTYHDQEAGNIYPDNIYYKWTNEYNEKEEAILGTLNPVEVKTINQNPEIKKLLVKYKINFI